MVLLCGIRNGSAYLAYVSIGGKPIPNAGDFGNFFTRKCSDRGSKTLINRAITEEEAAIIQHTHNRLKVKIFRSK